MDNKTLQQEILALQQEVLDLENKAKTIEETIGAIKQRVQNLKDIAWDRQSKKESSQMYKVLQNEKTHTQVKSDVGNIKVDKDFMEKQTKKHLDNPNLRGMVTTEEMLSYPKVAKNVGAEYNPQQQGYDWKVRANDGNTIIYGERKYDGQNRLLTAHSKPERGERGHSHQQFNAPNFHNSANAIITQKGNENQANISNLESNNQAKKPIDFQAKLKEFTENKLQNKNPSKDKDINR